MEINGERGVGAAGEEDRGSTIEGQLLDLDCGVRRPAGTDGETVNRERWARVVGGARVREQPQTRRVGEAGRVGITVR